MEKKKPTIKKTKPSLSKKTKPVKCSEAGQDQNVIDISEIDEKPTLKLSELPQKQQAFLLLQEQGLTSKEIAESLGYHPAYARAVKAKLAKYSLTDRKMVKSAHSAVKNILEGKTWGSIDKIKDNTALTAAQMVYDRVEPTKQANAGDTNISFTQINLVTANGR